MQFEKSKLQLIPAGVSVQNLELDNTTGGLPAMLDVDRNSVLVERVDVHATVKYPMEICPLPSG